MLFIEGKMVEDHTVLSDLGVQSGQTVQVEIQSADPVNRPLHYRQASPAYKLPDKVNVKVEVGKYIQNFVLPLSNHLKQHLTMQVQKVARTVPQIV